MNIQERGTCMCMYVLVVKVLGEGEEGLGVITPSSGHVPS